MKDCLHKATRFVAFAAALALASGAATPADAAKREKKQKPRQVHPTGEEDAKVPSVAELQAEVALGQMTSRSDEGLTVVQHENGMASMDLEGRFMSVMVAKEGATGAQCVDTHAKVQKARTAGPEAPPVAAAPSTAPKVAPALEEK
jgi:hypothetical protein